MSEKFNVVVSGDGWAAAELGTFDKTARQLITGLRSLEPFAGVDSTIRWYIVSAESARSGIRSSRERAVPGTYFGIVRDSATSAVSKPLADRIEAAKQSAKAEGAARVDLVLVIANTPEWTGHGWFAMRTAVVALAAGHSDLFAKLAAHECAHAICDCAEERVSGVSEAYQPHVHPNMANLEQVAASVKGHIAGHPAAQADPLLGQLGRWNAMDSVWWHDLKGSSAANGQGPMTIVHDPGDPWNHATDQNADPQTSLGQLKVGAYWGCQNTLSANATRKRIATLVGTNSVALINELAGTGQGNSGALYYRPAAQCCMRAVEKEFDQGHPFCPVCEHVLRNTILGVSGQAGKMSAPDWPL